MKKGQPRYASWKREGFPLWLQQRLEERDWKIADLGRQMGLTTSAIARWMSGQNTPGPETLLRLADVLQVSYDEVLTEAGLRPRMVSDDDPKRAEINRRVAAIPLTEKNYQMLLDLLNVIESWGDRQNGGPPRTGSPRQYVP